MTTRTFSRARTGVLALSLAAGGLLLAPSAAQAGILDTPQLQSTISFSNSGPAACTASGPGNATNGPLAFAADGVPVTSTVSSSRTFTNNGDAGDVSTFDTSLTTTMTATSGADALGGFTFVAQGQNKVTATKGTAQQCGGSSQSTSVSQFKFDLPTTRAVTVDIEGSATWQVTFQRTVPASPTRYIQLTSLGDDSAGQVTKILPAGTWQGSVISQSSITAPTAANPAPNETLSVSVKATFGQPGAATGPASGDGGKYLSLANGRTCAAGTLAATWKGKAGKGKNRKVAKASFFVNDVKVKTVKKPKKGQVTTLSGLVAGKPAEVEARIKLAKKGAGTVTVERSYVIC